MKKHVLLFCLAAVVLAACSTPTLKTIPTWTPRLVTKHDNGIQMLFHNRARDGQVSRVESKDLEAVRIEDISARREYLKDLSASHTSAVLDAQKTLEGMKEAATRYSVLNFAIGGTGILSGITSAVLVAASPANAAAVAGFNALTTGVVGFQTLAGNEGFSRATVAETHRKVLDELRKSEDEYQGAYAKLTMTASDDGWETSARAAEAAVGNIARIALWVPMPEVVAKPQS